ncbi:copper amine oxidase N-terminal domain-containing protein [Paenibacillus periandrae]|uniref:copper amine oxidase N-terminal domain-containing protein n=1 Tax=Paenibacillus periandrae TaxID=1761741 RepID=UPI001F09AC4B|nr:copper amine oxidase N-terminal domain-containing protein [Paenibacillus periandrae]
MKRFKWILAMIFTISLLITMTNESMAEEDGTPYQIIVNGETFQYDYPPIVENNAIYVPMWGVLGKLQVPVQKRGSGYYQIALPDRLVAFPPRGNIINRFDFTKENITGKDVIHRSRMEVPVLTKNDVIYIPIIFLQKYLAADIGWGEDRTITITGKSYELNESWKNTYENIYKKTTPEVKYKSYEDYKNQLQVDMDHFAQKDHIASEAEFLFSSYKDIPLYINKNAAEWDGLNHLEEVYIVGYDGLKVTFSGQAGEFSHIFKVAGDIKKELYTTNPFAGKNWSTSAKDAIKNQQIENGMDEDMVLLSWGRPTDISVYHSNKLIYLHWTYGKSPDSRHIFYYNGKVATVSN